MKRALGNRCYDKLIFCVLCAVGLAASLTGCNSSSAPPDKTPPTAPTNLVATVVSSTQINLTWTASTDNVGVTGYEVDRCQGANCSNFTQIATPTTTSFNDTGLAASTLYSYKVSASDAAGNVSAFSGVSSAMTKASGGPIAVSITPVRGGAVVGQNVTFSASVQNDVGAAGVTWSTSAGSFSSQSTTTATLVAPNATGNVSIKATSVADGTKSASATMGVTDLAGVTTWRYDNTRAGANVKEFALTTTNVTSAMFGKLFSCAADASVYAQPLWVANLSISGGTHNVIFVATVHDTVYAFDADASPCKTYWQKSLLGSGETWVSSNDVNTSDITPDIGIIGTPVIDPAKTTLFVVSKSKANGTNCTPASSCHQRIHALNLADGTEKFKGPTEISATVRGTGDGSSGGMLAFDSLTENQRPALTYLNGTVYIAWASHGDNGPYHGWIIGYNATSLTQTTVFNTDPDGGLAGIWMSGNGLAVDANNYLYCLTGNGTFDGTFPPVPGADDFGDSALKLNSSAGLSLADFFTPSNQSALNSGDVDVGSGGVVILPDQSVGGHTRLLFHSSKSGTIYLLDRDNMGKFNSSSDQVVQEFLASGGGFWSTPAFWQNTMYAGGSNDNVLAWPFNHSAPGQFDATSSSSSPTAYGFPGSSPVISASGTTNGIVWAIDASAYGQPCCANGPAVLHAYDATNLANELWNSGLVATDQAGNAVKFTVPMVANGKVYVGALSELDVYGLKPN